MLIVVLGARILHSRFYIDQQHNTNITDFMQTHIVSQTLLFLSAFKRKQHHQDSTCRNTFFIDKMNSTLLMNTACLASFELLDSSITSMTLVSLRVIETPLPIHPCNACVPKSLLPMHSNAFIVVSATFVAFCLPFLFFCKNTHVKT